MDDTVLLRAIDLTKSYLGGAGMAVKVFQQVSFELRRGESMALTGPSGSGKTTLLNLCAGLDGPTSGRVVLLDHDLSLLGEDARAKVRLNQVGFVFQNFQLIPTLSVLENVLLPLELRGDFGRTDEAMALLGRIGLANRRGHLPAQLSGGEQQRVAVVRAFISRPEILFCDEPTGNLDRGTAQSVADLIFSLCEESGAGLVLATHNLDIATRCHTTLSLGAGSAACLHKGEKGFGNDEIHPLCKTSA